MTQVFRHLSSRWLPSLAVVILGAALLAGCGPDPSEMIKHARKLDDRFRQAFKSEDVDAIMAAYWNDPGLVVMPPGAMVINGPEGVREDFKNFFDGTRVKNFAFKKQEYRVYGDVVVGWGTFKIVTDPSLGPEVTIEGRYSQVAGERDGQWVYLIDHASLPIDPKAIASRTQAGGKKAGGGSK